MPLARVPGQESLANDNGLGDADTGSGAGHLTGPHGGPHPLIPVSFAVLLLVLATTSQGAFAVSRWAPLALFALATLIGAMIARGSLVAHATAVRVALAGIWGFAAWSMLSMTWADSSGNAWLGGNRAILYAAIVTLPFVLPLPRRSLAIAGWSISAGIGAIAVYVLLQLLINGAPLFLAGRLNGPVDYRNATALLFALPIWPLIIASAARTYRRSLRATALAVATLCLGLAFLTQSRGILLGLAAGGLLTLAIGPDRVRRAWLAGLVVAALAAASPWLLRPFHAFSGGSGYVSPHTITVAAVALALMTIAAFVAGMAIALFDNGLRSNSPQMSQVRSIARGGLIAVVAIALVAAAVAVGNPVTYAQKKWDQFTSLQSTTPTGTRLLTVGGQRYDLWRVAVKEFGGAPVLGVGTDNYLFDYYLYRRTNRNLNDPHSLAFALLSENGAVGVVLFVVFLGGLGAVIRSRWRTVAVADKRHVIAPAAAGAVLLGQCTVDWIWLIPGLTAVGLFALAVAAAQVAAPGEGEDAVARVPVNRRLARLGHGGALGGLLVAALSVLALFLADAYVQRARTLDAQPQAELSAARAAARLDPWSVTPLYLQASALESMGDRAGAYAQLRTALSLEPQNSATLGVLGDFEARGHSFAAARFYYRRALALNPLDVGLQQLARIGESASAPGAQPARR